MEKKEWYKHLTPLVFAVFPILSIAFENINYIQFSSIARSLIIAIFAAYIFYLIIFMLLKNWNKAGILSSVIIFLMLSYGNIYLFFENSFGKMIRHRYLLLIFVSILILVVFLVIYRVKNTGNLFTAIFVGGFVICSYLLIAIGIYSYRLSRSEIVKEESDDLFSLGLDKGEISDLPDIYLIILDGHTRSDVLKREYDYDNSDFILKLEELGFWVADCAQSNYPGTNFSITSLLEMDYLHNIYEDFDNLVLPPLDSTRVLKILDENNYHSTIFDNYFFDHFDIDEDILFNAEDGITGKVNEFEMMLVEVSILRILIDMEGFFPRSWVRPFKDDIYLTHYRDAAYALKKLPELPKMDEQLFAYAHLLVTHDPFVFLPDGSYGSSKKGEVVDYHNVVEYIDTALPEILEEIINSSEEAPIIIVMGDHGATIKGISIESRMSILFAMYLQGEEPDGFYDEITPVNAFRLVFNYLFDADLELIDDKSFEIWNFSDLGNMESVIPISCRE